MGGVGPYTGDMLIRDALTSHPGAASVFERHGLHCAACIASGSERLGSIAGMHDVSVTDIIDDLNKLLPVHAEGDTE